jgi:hypothetical protein
LIFATWSSWLDDSLDIFALRNGAGLNQYDSAIVPGDVSMVKNQHWQNIKNET